MLDSMRQYDVAFSRKVDGTYEKLLPASGWTHLICYMLKMIYACCIFEGTPFLPSEMNIFYFPLLVLKGTYATGHISFFKGLQANGGLWDGFRGAATGNHPCRGIQKRHPPIFGDWCDLEPLSWQRCKMLCNY